MNETLVQLSQLLLLHFFDFRLTDLNLFLNFFDVDWPHGVLLVNLTQNTLHIRVGILVAMLDLELVPDLPE